VSLRGEALYQRLSHAILTHAGMGELSVETVDDYVACAVELAGDGGRLAGMRAGLRDRLRASPLGDAKGFVRDYFELVAGAAEGRS
jgi:protein O-GlcNAc transferase